MGLDKEQGERLEDGGPSVTKPRIGKEVRKDAEARDNPCHWLTL